MKQTSGFVHCLDRVYRSSFVLPVWRARNDYSTRQPGRCLAIGITVGQLDFNRHVNQVFDTVILRCCTEEPVNMTHAHVCE